MKKKSKIVVFSVDAMVYEDLEHIDKMPNLKSLLKGGSIVKRTRTIYPSVTYPAHTTMSSGAYPNKHGIVNNLFFLPGKLKDIPWHWFAEDIKCPDIFTAVKNAGLTTAAVFWPVTGCHKDIDYLVAEYWPQGPEDTKEACFLRAGTSKELYDKTVAPYMEGLKIRTHPATDDFLINCSCDIIKLYKPDLLMIHTGDVDSFRHKTGVYSPLVTSGLDETDRYIGQLIEATKEAGVYDETNFFIISDHGQMNIVRSVKPNVVLADHGFITYDENGKLTDWKAYCHSTGMSSEVHLKDPDDKETHDAVYKLLCHMRDEGIYGISEVYTAKEIDELEHISGDFAFMLETDGYSSFADGWTRPIVKELDITDYRFGHATHGYMPDKGPQPTFIAFGPDIKQGVEIERRPTVDEAPTYAKILGVEMPWADGVAIEEILK